MTAIAPQLFIAHGTPRFVTPIVRATRSEQDDLLDLPQTVAASPWRAPLFYLSFVAGAVLLVAIAIVLTWRMVTGLRQA